MSMGFDDNSTTSEATACVAADIPCVHCNYNLRTLTVESRCPECAADVCDSLAQWESTHNGEWIDSIHHFSGWLGWGPLVFIVAGAALWLDIVNTLQLSLLAALFFMLGHVGGLVLLLCWLNWMSTSISSSAQHRRGGWMLIPVIVIVTVCTLQVMAGNGPQGVLVAFLAAVGVVAFLFPTTIAMRAAGIATTCSHHAIARWAGLVVAFGVCNLVWLAAVCSWILVRDLATGRVPSSGLVELLMITIALWTIQQVLCCVMMLRLRRATRQLRRLS